MKYFRISLIIVTLFSIISCSDNAEIINPKVTTDFTYCMQNRIEEFKLVENSKAVYKIKKEDQIHYLFYTGLVNFGEVDFIYNLNCEIACSYHGGYSLTNCISDYPGYENEKWELVWKK